MREVFILTNQQGLSSLQVAARNEFMVLEDNPGFGETNLASCSSLRFARTVPTEMGRRTRGRTRPWKKTHRCTSFGTLTINVPRTWIPRYMPCRDSSLVCLFHECWGRAGWVRNAVKTGGGGEGFNLEKWREIWFQLSPAFLFFVGSFWFVCQDLQCILMGTKIFSPKLCLNMIFLFGKVGYGRTGSVEGICNFSFKRNLTFASRDFGNLVLREATEVCSDLIWVLYTFLIHSQVTKEDLELKLQKVFE